MTRLFRSKSCGVGRTSNIAVFNSSPPSPSLYLSNEDEDEDEEEEEEEEEDQYLANNNNNSVFKTPFISTPDRRRRQVNQNHQFPILAILAAALRKSLVTCSAVEAEDVSSTDMDMDMNMDMDMDMDMDIGCPTDVRHVSHVTFDRFNGFLGLPIELQPDVPRKVPSASASVFGVSAKSMQCSYDQRGNSVPTILLLVQQRLYSEGGLQAEGIFRINAENSQEEHVRGQLNRGVVPHGIDVHCLAGLIKAWFRELPTGVLDSLTPEQVMHCNTEEECIQLVQLLPPTEAALLDWAINLMADVVHHENYNKMNARNIAMVFAPNMTQMADPLTALIHAVQVMNLLKTLIMRTLREREESGGASAPVDSPSNKVQGDPTYYSSSKSYRGVSCECSFDGNSGRTESRKTCSINGNHRLLRSSSSVSLDRVVESDWEEKLWSFKSKSDGGEELIDERSSTVVSGGRRSNSSAMNMMMCKRGTVVENGCGGGGHDDINNNGEEEEVEIGILDRLRLRKGVRKLSRHPVFQLNKPLLVKKKTSTSTSTGGRGGLGIVNTS